MIPAMDDEEFLRRCEAVMKKKNWAESTLSRRLFSGDPRRLKRMRQNLSRDARKRRAQVEKKLASLESEEGEKALCR